MKTLIAAIVLSTIAGAAFAGEGNGNPFPYNAGSVTVQVAPSGYHAMQEAPMPTVSSLNSVPALPTNGSEGIVQTANSLPVGATDGT